MNIYSRESISGIKVSWEGRGKNDLCKFLEYDHFIVLFFFFFFGRKGIIL